MNTISGTKIVSHKFNGHEDTVTVEIEGKKYVADPADPTKPKLGDDQKPVLFTETNEPVVPKIEDVGKAELAELAKVNPHVAKMMEDAKNRSDSDSKAEKERKDKEEKEAAAKGEWQALATTRGTELETTKATLGQKEEMLGKYVEMTKTVLAGLMKSIPKENLGLIPAEFSPRQQLEYIVANAERLGAKVNAIGGPIEKSEVKPEGTDEDKMVARISELTKLSQERKATSVQLVELAELGSKLTALRREKGAK